MTAEAARTPPSAQGRAVFWAAWLAGTVLCTAVALAGLYLSLFMLAGLAMDNDLSDWLILAAIFAAAPTAVACVLVSLVLGLRRRYRPALLAFVPSLPLGVVLVALFR